MRDEPETSKSSFAADLIEVIQHSKIFADIDRAACESLLPRLERIVLKQGETLFEQGDPSDCLYILVDGQLMAQLLTSEGKNKIVGTIEKGETVGELGALSNQPRSLTIRAAIDSRILKLPRKQFEEFCKEQPNFIARIIDLIVSRSQNTIKLISQKKIYKHIAIIRGNQEAPLDKFIKKLKENFGNAKFTFLDEDSTKENLLAHIIDQAEQENKTVFFVLDEDNFEGARTKLNHIGGIYIVVDGDIPSDFSDFALSMLSRQRTPFTTQYELVLVHDDHVTVPIGTMEWLKKSNFTLHHHIKLNNDRDLQRLLRFMMGRAVGLVLGGGGQKGWALIGALKALLDANIPIDIIGSTSVGATVGACYIKYLSYDAILATFTRFSQAVRQTFSLNNLTIPIISLVSTKSPTNILKNEFKHVQIEDLWLPFFSIASNLSVGKEVVHRDGTLWKKLRASTAIPGLATPMVLEGELYYDGGLLNNLPVDHMRNLIGDEGTIIAISLSSKDPKPIYYNFPPIIPFWVSLIKKLNLGYKKYKFPPFFNTFLSALLVGAASKEKANELIADILIAPNLSAFSILKLKKKAIKEILEIGYKSTQEQIQASRILEIKQDDVDLNRPFK